jgi:hypothetical protein
LVHRQAGIGDDPSKRARANARVVRYDDARMWIIAPKDHGAATLAAKHEASAFERRTYLSARKAGR